MCSSYRMLRTQRLSRTADIDLVRQMGRKVKAEHLDVRVAASPLSYARVGIVVPKHRRTIVKRNQLKRRLREIVRTRVLPVIQPCDILIRALPKAYDMTFQDLTREIDKVVRRIAVSA